MPRVMERIAPVLRLTRISAAFGAVANTWLVILWTRANEHEGGHQRLSEDPLWLLLSGGGVAALGLYAFGTVLNDVLDLRRDRALRPDRPLPTGRIGLDSAVVLVTAMLIGAVLGSTVFGTRGVLLTLLVAAAILTFNAMGKFIPAIGLVLLGLIYAGHMGVPNIRLRFMWPVWLVMTHCLVIAGLAHVLARKVPRLSRRALAAAALGWLFWSAVILAVGWHNSGGGSIRAVLWPDWVNPTAVIGPVFLSLLLALVLWRKTAVLGGGTRAAEKTWRYGAIWLGLYGCAWLFGQGAVEEGLILTALTVGAVVGLTVLREVYGLVEHPLGYRR